MACEALLAVASKYELMDRIAVLPDLADPFSNDVCHLKDLIALLVQEQVIVAEVRSGQPLAATCQSARDRSVPPLVSRFAAVS